MSSVEWAVHGLRTALANGLATPTELAQQALARSNRNAGRNTYLWQNSAWTMAEATRMEAMPRGQDGAFGDGRGNLWGLPISVKDCFDLAGAPTSCGVRLYRDLHGAAAHDSWLVEQLRSAGAVIIGKTHLHPLAYGITGENPEFGDCEQPSQAGALTGGSSSGAAASVLESSAVAAIGTDTGGSIRVPAALCGLAGYRATLGRGNWHGAAHLAPSFDTMGWLFRDLEDAPLLAAPFATVQPSTLHRFTRFALLEDSFLHDCDPVVIASLRQFARQLEVMGLRRSTFSAPEWSGAFSIFAPIQAWEAARIHAGRYEEFQAAIRERLEWGARIADSELAALRRRYMELCERMDALFAEHELLLLPASPVVRLAAGADHSQTRSRLLRYTTPFSLGGVPVVTVPCAAGGVQVAAPRGMDESLLQLAAQIGACRKNAVLKDIS